MQWNVQILIVTIRLIRKGNTVAESVLVVKPCIAVNVWWSVDVEGRCAQIVARRVVVVKRYGSAKNVIMLTHVNAVESLFAQMMIVVQRMVMGSMQ